MNEGWDSLKDEAERGINRVWHLLCGSLGGDGLSIASRSYLLIHDSADLSPLWFSGCLGEGCNCVLIKSGSDRLI